jgi:hypothetical protein
LDLAGLIDIAQRIDQSESYKKPLERFLNGFIHCRPVIVFLRFALLGFICHDHSHSGVIGLSPGCSITGLLSEEAGFFMPYDLATKVMNGDKIMQ